MSEWAAINIIEKNGKVTVLKHRWGVLDEIIPALQNSADEQVTAEDLAMAVLYDNNFRLQSPTTKRKVDITKLLTKQGFASVYSYNLYATKDGWDIEVWKHSSFPLWASRVRVPFGTTGDFGHRAIVSPIATDGQFVIARRPLSSVTPKDIKVAETLDTREHKRVVKLAKAGMAARAAAGK